MAGSMLCDSQHDTPADIVVTNVRSGDVFALCVGCFPEWARSMADALDMVVGAAASGDADADAQAGREADPDDDEDDDEGLHLCETCGATFATVQHLGAHIAGHAAEAIAQQSSAAEGAR